MQARENSNQKCMSSIDMDGYRNNIILILALPVLISEDYYQYIPHSQDVLHSNKGYMLPQFVNIGQ